MDIEDIKRIRKNLGITQKELAKLSGVSQSLIAKIESGILDPSYTNAMKIMNALDDIMHKRELAAKDLMNKKIIMIEKDISVKDAIKKMKRYNISQLPVCDDDKIIGLITEKILLDCVLDGNIEANVLQVMHLPPPIIGTDSPIDMIRDLLKYWPIVIVHNSKRYIGIITKADILQSSIK